jgi:hemerythrin
MRRFVRWRAEWLLCIDPIDQEHQALVEQLNELAECHRCARRSRQGGRASAAPVTIGEMLQNLGEQVREHFHHEEENMRENGYPDYDAHRYEHATLLAEFAQLLREIRADGLQCFDHTTLEALKSWLIGHIAGADRRYGDYYREHILGISHPQGDEFLRRWMQISLRDEPPSREIKTI